jgi:phosphonate transport system ATP-binding protein
MTLLRARDLGVTYAGGRRVLAGACLEIARGELVVLLGPSGAGKSTLLRALNGLVPHEAGTVEAEGLGTLAGAEAWRVHRRRTGMVFQQHQLIGRLTALANTLLGRLAFHGTGRTFLPWPRADKRIALEALERVGLLEEALRRVDQLSVGQQQRVGVARALAQQPQLVLADEPVASLDPAAAERVLDLLRDICRADGIAALVSLHQVELARRFADRVIGISAGELVFDGAPAALDDAALARIYHSRGERHEETDLSVRGGDARAAAHGPRPERGPEEAARRAAAG